MCKKITEYRQNMMNLKFGSVKKRFTASRCSERNDLFQWAKYYCSEKGESDEGVKKILAALICEFSDLVRKKPTGGGSSKKRKTPKALQPRTAELSRRARKRQKTLRQAAEVSKKAKPKVPTEAEFLQGEFPSCIKIDDETEVSTKNASRKICRVNGCSKVAVRSVESHGEKAIPYYMFCIAHYKQIARYRERDNLEPFLLDPNFGKDMETFTRKHGL